MKLKSQKAIPKSAKKDVKELMSQLETLDYSQYSDKARVKREVFHKMAVLPYQRENGALSDKKKERLIVLKKSLIAAAMIIIATSSILQTTWSQEMVEKMIHSIKLEHIEAEQYDDSTYVPKAIPKNLRGQVFDEKGNRVEVITDDLRGKLYTKDGEKIAGIDEKNQIITRSEYDDRTASIAANTVIEKDPDELVRYICFKPKFLEYVPENYHFDRGEFYKDEEGKVENSKYLTMYYKNDQTGEEIFVQERFACEETAYGWAGNERIEEMDLNGNRAILIGDSSLSWEIDGVLMHISINGNPLLTREDLIKMGESIK